MLKSLLFLLFSLTLLLSGCQTPGVILKETPLGVSDARRAIVAVIGAPRSVSSNGRELYSKYYDSKGIFIEEMDKMKYRYHSKVTILGDRRPYDIAVLVVYEARIDGKFEVVDQDNGRALQLAEKIKKSLHESREKRNVIDDFRSF